MAKQRMHAAGRAEMRTSTLAQPVRREVEDESFLFGLPKPDNRPENVRLQWVTPLVDAPDVVKEQKKKFWRSGQTLFLDPEIGETDWRTLVTEGQFAEIYVPLDTVPAPKAIAFAARVRDEILARHVMIDPVVIGPVTGKIIDEYESDILDSGLTTTSSSSDGYAKRAAARSSKSSSPSSRK